MKETLLSIVKEILDVSDSEDVNSISDTVEALQAAGIVREVWRELIVEGLPEHESLIKLVSLSDNTTPSHFRLADEVKDINCVWYDNSDDNSFNYRPVKPLQPEDFLKRVDGRSTDFVNVKDLSAGTNLRIGTDRHPSYYTTFDDEHLVFDSYKSTVDNSLQESKVRAMGVVYPTFSVSDDYTPDLDNHMFPLLIQESKSRFISVFKGQPDPKIEQSARRQRFSVDNDKRRAVSKQNRVSYGRN